MSFSERKHKKNIESAAKLLPPDVRIRCSAVGQGHARLTAGPVIAIGVMVVAIVVAALLGYYLFPGAIVILYVRNSIRPPRAVVVTDQSLIIMEQHVFSRKVNRIIETLPLAPMWAPSPSGKVTLELGSERITFSRTEFNRLAGATTGAPAIGAWPQSA